MVPAAAVGGAVALAMAAAGAALAREASVTAAAAGEPDALATYWDRLTVAFIGAVVKQVNEDGSVEVRIVHDGTHGIDLITHTKVRDQVPHPTATDIQRAL